MHRISAAAACALAAALALAAFSSAGTASATPRQPSAVSHRSSKVLRLRFTNEGPPITILAPLCDAAKHCLFPFTETGTYHGDLEGTHITAGTSALEPNGQHDAVTRTDLFVGTVKGCGTGTFVAQGTENATPTAGAGQSDIAIGFGTGDLARLSGHEHGTGTAGPAGIRSTITADLRCA